MKDIDYVLEDMKVCPECQHLKMLGVIPAVCQYHLDEQMRCVE